MAKMKRGGRRSKRTERRRRSAAELGLSGSSLGRARRAGTGKPKRMRRKTRKR